MKYKIDLKINDILEIKISNKKGEYSIFKFKATKENVEGDEPELFLKETTGVEEE